MWLAAQEKPQLNIIGYTEHRHLAAAVARRALTLVRDGADLLPIKLLPGERMAIIMPRPADLTPADTSSYVTPELAQSIQAYHPHVDEIIIPQRPSDSEISSLREKATQYKLLIIGTISAHLQLEQATMVNQLLATGIPTITLSMRTPYDLTVYPQAKTHICTYGIQAVVMNALAAAMWGTIPFRGRLPVQLPGLYDFGHGLES
jgi:beta-N-acetylhexosaminidase